MQAQRIVMATRPEGRPSASNFRLEQFAIPEIDDGHVLLETLYLSLDPYMRGMMKKAESYASPLEIGDTMPGGTVSRVLQSRNSVWQPGDIVTGWGGWQTHSVSAGSDLRRLDPDAAPPSTALGILGLTGFTAYSGLLTIGKPKSGETVVVAAASGPVGGAVGQIARIHGARAVGIAGGPEKCAFVRDVLGFDAVVDHRAPDFADQLAKACPDGIDIYFENVGGAVWDAVLPLLNQFARVPLCGQIAHYNDTDEVALGPDRLVPAMRDILSKSITVRGFIQTEFQDTLFNRFHSDASRWLAEGRLRHREDVVDGLAQAPEAFIGMLEGRNFGKVLVHLV